MKSMNEKDDVVVPESKTRKSSSVGKLKKDEENKSLTVDDQEETHAHSIGIKEQQDDFENAISHSLEISGISEEMKSGNINKNLMEKLTNELSRNQSQNS